MASTKVIKYKPKLAHNSKKAIAKKIKWQKVPFDPPQYHSNGRQRMNRVKVEVVKAPKKARAANGTGIDRTSKNKRKPDNGLLRRTPVAGKTNANDDSFLKIDNAVFGKELVKAGGIISLLCRKYNVTRAAVLKKIASSEYLQDSLKDIRENTVDLAEIGLGNALNEEAQWAIQMVLKTVGRNRGYTDAPIEHKITLNATPDLTEQQLRDIIGPDKAAPDDAVDVSASKED